MESSKKLKALICFSLLFSPLFGEDSIPINKSQIAYLMQSKEIDKSIQLYLEYKKNLGRHDFEILHQIGSILLEQGCKSPDEEIQLLSIFGAGIAGMSTPLGVLEAGLHSRNGQTQIASIQYLGRLQDDRCDELLIKAMASDFFPVRLEAGYLLSLRKHRSASGQIEALMYKVPPFFRFIFPEFFALIGTSDAVTVLRHLMQDRDPAVRVESILSAAKHGRDDLLPVIRSHTSHLNPAEQEACATALGEFKDQKSLLKLKKLTTSPSPQVTLAALYSLHQLGDQTAKEGIFNLAKEHNLFAINLLAELPDSNDLLYSLTKNEDIQIRFNASLALLRKKDPRCVGSIREFLIYDLRDLTFYPQGSLGRSLVSWKVLSSAEQHGKIMSQDLRAVAVAFREQILREALELPEKDFLFLAREVFDQSQKELTPLLVGLLQNHQSKDAIALLEQQAHKAGAPFVRAYCHLALLRLGKIEHREFITTWINEKKNLEMIRFRPMLERSTRTVNSLYELTAEESSRLLIESCQVLAMRHEEQGIDLLLETMASGHPKNRYALAGLLLCSIQ